MDIEKSRLIKLLTRNGNCPVCSPVQIRYLVTFPNAHFDNNERDGRG